jgi:hypothetical protein
MPPIDPALIPTLPDASTTLNGLCCVQNAVDSQQLVIDLAKGIKLSNVSIGESDLNTILFEHSVAQPKVPNTTVSTAMLCGRNVLMQVVVFPVSTGSAQPAWFNAPAYSINAYFEPWQQWDIKALVMMKGQLAQPLDVSPLTGTMPTYSNSLQRHFVVLNRF